MLSYLFSMLEKRNGKKGFTDLSALEFYLKVICTFFKKNQNKSFA